MTDATTESYFRGLPWRRIAVTLGALAVFRAGLKIPAPGLSIDGITSAVTQGSFPGALERLSIFALGLMPLLSILILLEVLKLAAPDWMASFRRKGASGTEIGPRVTGFALALAALQAYGVALALEAAGTGSAAIVADPGASFRTTYVLTAVAATAFLIWLADQITRHGIGSGVWLLLSAATLGSAAQALATLRELLATGVFTGIQAIAFVTSIVVAVGILVAIARAIQAALPEARNHALAQTLLWPPLIAISAYGYISGLASMLQNAAEIPTSGSHFFQYGTVSGLILLVALNFFLTRAMSPAPPGLVLASAAVTSGLSLLTEVWIRYGMPDWIDYWLIPITLASLVTLPLKLDELFPDKGRADRNPVGPE